VRAYLRPVIEAARSLPRSKRDTCCPVGGFFIVCNRTAGIKQAVGSVRKRRDANPSWPVRHPEPLRPQKRTGSGAERFADAERLHHQALRVRLAALATAFNEAVTMLASMPTP
jgi:hypothetical protein